MAESAIGLLGGIFDPVHYGHLAIAQLAVDYFGLESLFLIPAGLPPHKAHTVHAGPQDRLAMLSLAVKGSGVLQIRDEELHRPGHSYTIDTIELFRRQYPDRPIHFIIGGDNLPEIRTWYRYTEILEHVTLCVTARPGYSSEIPAELAHADIRIFPSPHLGISSSLLREYLSKGYSCRYLVPEPVLDYISAHGLYRSAVTVPG